MTDYKQELKYLDNWPEIKYKLDNSDLSFKYPANLNVGYVEGVELKKGDTVRLVDKESGINGLYEIVAVKKDKTVRLKFIKKIKEK